MDSRSRGSVEKCCICGPLSEWFCGGCDERCAGELPELGGSVLMIRCGKCICAEAALGPCASDGSRKGDALGPLTKPGQWATSGAEGPALGYGGRWPIARPPMSAAVRFRSLLAYHCISEPFEGWLKKGVLKRRLAAEGQQIAAARLV